ncbi:MAG TPA: beta-L-arabinofuranosidase domain-containing protein [Patescibacteria group bacterium]|nr:beta-L-arabinofuranosidase domain-containing protein [Patescibacteria group bacterium]
MTASLTAGPVDATRSPAATLRTLAGGAVMFEDGLWARRQAVNRAAALPHGLRMLETAGNLDNLRIAAGRATGRFRGRVFMDSDVYKWLEAAAFEMARVPSAELSKSCDTLIELVAAAQGDDGYINSYYTVAEPGRRWTDLTHGHELYCLGHMLQAALAFRRGTGDDRLLAIATRFVDLVHSVFGPGRRETTDGHAEIEMALVELYRETGERRHLDLAVFFLEQRGRGRIGPNRHDSPAAFQDRVPVREATTVEGHAVRALYLTTGAADVYLETGDAALRQTLTRQWEDMVEGKLYLTGGVGARHLAESFGHPYELPSDLAYSETCGAIASLMWSWRMLLATGQARYADLIERTLYNAILGGVSLDGHGYFYVNPLASDGEVEHLHRGGPRRKPWHLVACCPPNVMRLLASLGHYVATHDDSGLQIHQYAAARIKAPGVTLGMETDYPWEGRVWLTVEEASAAARTLTLRVPGWCTGASVRVNDRAAAGAEAAGGYVRLERTWSRGDVVELDLPMPARYVEAHPWIESTRGCVAIERGPLVYCLEQSDHPGMRLADLEIDAGAPLAAAWEPDRLDGVAVVRAHGREIDTGAWQQRLYRPLGSAPPAARRPIALTAIPYYAWANREPGAMRVWMPRAEDRA